MKLDDPIALLRSLDPAADKDVEALAGALDRERVFVRAPRRSGRRRGAWLLVAAAVVAAAVAALVANPFARDGAISSAQAQEQAARALDLEGNWHITRVTEAGEAVGPAAPKLSHPDTEEAWHAADGRLLLSSTFEGSNGVTGRLSTLYARGERRVYDPTDRTVRIHHFVLAADMRDDQRTYIPQTAAELYRAAYRLGKVRLAGIAKLDGRRVYRLAFDWLGSSYTLVFDAQRRVPISSESRSHEGGDRWFVIRVRYTAYERVEPGPGLDRHLRLPPLRSGVKTVREPPIVVPPPIAGASASALTRQIPSHFGGAFTTRALAAHATYAFARRLDGGSVAALVSAPVSGAPKLTRCIAMIEVAHPGGEASVSNSGCSTPGLLFAAPTRDGRTMIFAGTTNWPRIELRFDGGPVLKAQVHDGLWFATAPSALFRHDLVIVSTNRAGSRSISRPFGLFAIPGQLPGWRNP